MRIEVQEAPNKSVYFWMSSKEASSKAIMDTLKPQFKAWKSKGYLPVVFESGTEKLEDSMYMLMKRNYNILAQKELPVTAMRS